MKITNRDFKLFGKKKKKQPFPSLEALKLVSFVTGTALAVNKALREKLKNQQLALHKKKQDQSEEIAIILAGFVGGLLAGSISALLLTPESGQDLRKRIAGYFENGHGHTPVKNVTKKAKKQAANAEKKINGNS